jgi:hypothetical protein
VTMTGISAVLLPADQPFDESAVLDLAAVLEGLVGDRFEVILVCAPAHAEVDGLRARAPRLPLRVVDGASIADGCDAAQYELIFVAAGDGEFDVRELNHLLDAVEMGADVAVGYRPGRMDGLVRRFQRWGFKVQVDCAFALVRRGLCSITPRSGWCWTELLAGARRSGYRVAEVPVSHRRPHIGVPLTSAA